MAVMEAIAVAATVAKGFFAYAAGQAQKDAYRKQARQREMQAVSESADRLRDGRASIATGAAIAGASGFTTEGSASDVLGYMAQLAETNAARARFDGYRDANELRFRGRTAAREGTATLAVSLLDAGSQMKKPKPGGSSGAN